MPERAGPRSDADLERALIELGDAIAWPVAVDLAPRVRGRIEAAAGPRRWWLRPARRSLVLALAVLLLLATVAAAVGIGLPGLRILFAPGPAPTVPAPTPTDDAGANRPLGWNLGVGRQIELAEARSVVGFEPVLPTEAALREPDAAYEASGRLTLVYRATPDLPATAASDVGLVLTEFRGDVDGNWLEKAVHSGSTVERLTVDGQPGYWITGAPHFLLYVDESGVTREESRRIVGDVLIWREGELTMRLETAVGRGAALRIAEAMGDPR